MPAPRAGIFLFATDRMRAIGARRHRIRADIDFPVAAIDSR
jgi:hypothetical protein